MTRLMDTACLYDARAPLQRGTRYFYARTLNAWPASILVQLMSPEIQPGRHLHWSGLSAVGRLQPTIAPSPVLGDPCTCWYQSRLSKWWSAVAIVYRRKLCSCCCHCQGALSRKLCLTQTRKICWSLSHECNWNVYNVRAVITRRAFVNTSIEAAHSST